MADVDLAAQIDPRTKLPRLRAKLRMPDGV
jgi:hypothetical protein